MLPSSETLSKLITCLYEAAGDPDLWNPFLQRLAQITRAESAGLVSHDAGVHTISHSWEIDPEMARLHQEHYHSVDVWGLRGVLLPSGSVRSSQSLCPLAELKTTEVYNDFMVRFGLEHGLFAVVGQISRPRGGAVSLFRSSSSSEFETDTEEILCLLAGHLKQAFKLYGKFSDLKAQSAGLEIALDMHPTGIFLLGSTGQVVLMNGAASALVLERDGLLATRTGLRAERPAESSLLEKTIRQAASTSNGHGISAGGMMLISRRARPPLQIVVSPISKSALTYQAVAAIAFVTDPAQRQRPTRDVLKARFGLTPAECRVALLLGDGHAPRKIANMIGVTDNTVRSQIKSIFSKTGVNRQGELIRLLLNHSGPAIPREQPAL
jgi:DNA-binding CsgD family transcriptional regulator